ncbi:phage integrase family protein [Pleomorphomonas sp. SM30]|uniref:Phage integrase family protein with SAM-like domain n=1 Tax=Oharaeibacter diazotrophicus TaxID=1920512 RepID=A0A4R6RIX1_9HYPH|nr:site-specific integrase [Oharaeibacter diazotrophicus]TDP85586.1 phage integrase family protein with SAM-like domain [Oharaeibacter diazotrophicus]BBE74557.1 phage integrase family protein [Pleomorphomonas sp. SM30]GLS75744.1 integrase [Oharaeibacter diazotrophicus]
MSPRRKGPSVPLPAHVHRVVSKAREYFYYQEGRGSKNPGQRIKLPNDPHSPEFWAAVRQAQGIMGNPAADTINALADAYEAAWPTLQRRLTESTRAKYRGSLKVVRKAWGNLPAAALRPSHVQALMDSLAAKPGSANNVLDALRSMCRWAMGPRELLTRDPTQGVPHFDPGEGHKPWTPEQLAIADANFAGMVRRGYVLMRYTGQRISDVVRMGWTDLDEGGISLPQKKTGVRPWCPIFPELEAEMAGWEKRPGPFLLQDNGKPFTTNGWWKAFDAVRADHPALADAVPHGLRAVAAIGLRQHGLSIPQISDMVGMSPAMVERYCRHADRKAGGKAVLHSITEGRNKNRTVKP